MKLKIDVTNKTQPDPFIFADGDKFYIYVTANEGVEAYKSDDIFGEWKYVGIITETNDDTKDFWAPSVIKIDDIYYMYVSFHSEEHLQELHVFTAENPLGPFKKAKKLYNEFSIDSHAIQNETGLFLILSVDDLNAERVGTRIVVDRMIDPLTPENKPVEIVSPTFLEERFTPQCTPKRDWYTVEGGFYFKKDDWHYLMYSAGCYRDDTYHIGYATAKTTETDLTKIKFIKSTNNGGFNPIIIKNEFEEGTGHHSVIEFNGEYYAIYHGRDYTADCSEYNERRTARICKLNVSEGVITVERFENKI